MTNQFGGAVNARLIRAQPGARSVALQAGGEQGGWRAGERVMILALGMQGEKWGDEN